MPSPPNFICGRVSGTRLKSLGRLSAGHRELLCVIPSWETDIRTHSPKFFSSTMRPSFHFQSSIRMVITTTSATHDKSSKNLMLYRRIKFEWFSRGIWFGTKRFLKCASPWKSVPRGKNLVFKCLAVQLWGDQFSGNWRVQSVHLIEFEQINCRHARRKHAKWSFERSATEPRKH